MTEANEDNKYIKCTNCKCKYINDDENIKKDFGFNRLNEKFKTCVKCRGSSQRSRENKLKEEVEENEQRCPRCYKSKPANDFVGHTLVYKTCGACRLKDKGRIWSK
jgi:hypothetical protein